MVLLYILLKKIEPQVRFKTFNQFPVKMGVKVDVKIYLIALVARSYILLDKIEPQVRFKTFNQCPVKMGVKSPCKN